ncbi:putative serine hydrolase isoform X1 [Megachile rotundata]|uniref:putative serine hydrolase isoform X1 n=1 Tax=Megachile rotundata TaxID=143995 RepID=UPI003FD60C02
MSYTVRSTISVTRAERMKSRLFSYLFSWSRVYTYTCIYNNGKSQLSQNISSGTTLNCCHYFKMSQQNAVNSNNASAESVNGHTIHDMTEIKIPVPWGHISGKWWGSADIQPIVAIHGWQDNCGTFDALITLLPSNVSILAIDLPGHGFSSHQPPGQYYYMFWDGLLALRRVVNYFKWNKVKLIGHSLGGAISFLYAASYPDEVDFIISLDIASPNVKDVTKTPAVTGDLIDKFLKYELLKPENVPSYTYEEALDIVEDAYKGSITKESAKILMKRGMQPSSEPDRYYFSRDPRLKVSMLGTLSMDLVLAYAARIKCGYLNIRATSGLIFDKPESYDQVLNQIKLNARKFEYHTVDGTHHVHLNNPERIAAIINNFIST